MRHVEKTKILNEELPIFFLPLIIIILNCLIGHYLAPAGIIITPLILIITTSLVSFNSSIQNSIWKSIWCFFFVALNDVLIKLYSGGIHDSEGLIWVSSFMYIGLIPSYGILLYSIIKEKTGKSSIKIIASIILPVFIYIYLHFFGELGLGIHYE